MSHEVVAPWVLVAGGFHRRGGMDRANVALAEYLLERKSPVHLVSHAVDPQLRTHSLVTTHLVRHCTGSFFLADLQLNRLGRTVAQSVLAAHSGARVVVNGGNCDWGDINWVHCVHHAWPCYDKDAPLWFRAKNRVVKRIARERERTAFRRARIVIANSNRTRDDLHHLLNVNRDHCYTVYLGAESDWQPASSAERSDAKEMLGLPPRAPVVIFVGALSFDNNKGFDTLWHAWRLLCSKEEWDAQLLIAGWGNGLDGWQKKTQAAGLSDRMKFLGFTDQIVRVLGAADLLVSPSRYEAYGLNVQEAICRGVPAMISASAGIAERYPSELHAMLILDPNDVSSWVERLLRWRSEMEEWRAGFHSFGIALRRYSWRTMAEKMVSIAERSDRDQFMQSEATPGSVRLLK